MGRPRKAAPSLTLFGERLSREEAFELVERFPLRARIRREKVFESKNGVKYGPYLRWFALWAENGKRLKRYIRDEDKPRVELAHEIVRAELEAAERAAQTPQLQRLRELQRRAGVKRATDERVQTIPIMEVGRRRPK
jgi:hypothetical protein